MRSTPSRGTKHPRSDPFFFFPFCLNWNEFQVRKDGLSVRRLKKRRLLPLIKFIYFVFQSSIPRLLLDWNGLLKGSFYSNQPIYSYLYACTLYYGKQAGHSQGNDETRTENETRDRRGLHLCSPLASLPSFAPSIAQGAGALSIRPGGTRWWMPNANPLSWHCAAGINLGELHAESVSQTLRTAKTASMGSNSHILWQEFGRDRHGFPWSGLAPGKPGM